MMPRFAAKRDLSEPAIIGALEDVGAQVWQLDYPVDLLVRYRDRWHLLECKSPRGKSYAKDKRRVEQQTFIEATQTPVVCTPTDALKAIGATS